jgi:hypothetical protein
LTPQFQPELADAAYLEEALLEEDDAYQAFVEEPYVLQIAQDRRVTPGELWPELGEAYSKEFAAAQRARDPQDWHEGGR